MANLAPDPLCTKLLELAGITTETISRFIPEIQRSIKTFEERQRSLSLQEGALSIPLVHDSAVLNKRVLAPSDIDEWITADARYLPGSARALRINAREGRWMPLFPRASDIAVLDVTTPVKADNIEQAASTRSLVAVSVGRAEVPSGSSSPAMVVDPIPRGLYIGTLERLSVIHRELEEIRIIVSGGTAALVAFKSTPQDSQKEIMTVPVKDARTGVELSQDVWPDTGGRYVVQPGVEFIFPVLQLIRPGRANEQGGGLKTGEAP